MWKEARHRKTSNTSSHSHVEKDYFMEVEARKGKETENRERSDNRYQNTIRLEEFSSSVL